MNGIMRKQAVSRINTIGQGLPAWLQITIRIPFLFLFAWETLVLYCQRRQKSASFPCRSVSVIIPTRNEEKYIGPCIRSVSGNRHVLEIIVVDAGSNDQTRLMAEKAGACVMVHDRSFDNGGGRGGQVREGIHAARGDAIVILHADTILPGVEIDRIVALLNDRPDVAGGAVGCRFDSPFRRYRFLELANDFRAAVFKISFGDQVQFFRREPVVNCNIYPGIPLMEDIELSLRLRRLGKQVYLFGAALVSVRRWQKKGPKNAALIIRLLGLYLFKRIWGVPDAAGMYNTYYGVRQRIN